MLPLGIAAFVALGVGLVIVGANQAEMARDLAMDLGRSGFLGASLALGAGVGITGAGPLADRLPRRPLLAGACVLVALALLTVSSTMSYERAVAHIVLFGLGIGFYDTVLNVACMDRYGERAGAMLALVHAGATAGAVVGPPLIGVASAQLGWESSFHGLGVLYVALAVWAALVPLPDARAPHGTRGTEAPDPATPRRRGATLWTPALLGLALVAFAYVGVEGALTLFAVPWSVDGLGLGESTGRIAISAFWMGLLLGRIVLVPLRTPLGAGLLAVCGLAGGLVVCGASLLDAHPLILTMGLAGLALGPVYPVMISVAGQRFPHAAGTAAGLVGGAGALGGFLLPWATGALGDAVGIVAAIGILGLFSFVLGGAALALRYGSAPAVPRARGGMDRAAVE